MDDRKEVLPWLQYVFMSCFKSEYQQTIRAVAKALPAVVAILMLKTPEQASEKIEPDLLKVLPRDKNGLLRLGSCSGFFVSSDGYLLTNRHVVEDEEAVYEVVSRHQHYECEIKVRDEITDLAILKIKGVNFPYLKLGRSSRLQLGETVIAIGNALSEFENTVSRGIISGLSRHLKTDFTENNKEFFGLIQTDAAINPGNSGGPLINLKGEAIGINTAVVLGVENIGFAIPSDQAKIILEDLKKYGKIFRPSLGIRYLLIDEEVQKEHQLPFDYGAFIIFETLPGQKGIIPGGLAEKAGLKEGDIILTINNQKIDQSCNLMAALRNYQKGDKIKIKYWHQNEIKETEIVLED